MAGGLFKRIKNWASGDNLTDTDINNEFNNIIANFSPDKMAGFSSTVGQMQTTFNPGTVGAENLTTNTAQELEALRYMVGQITGGAQWYSPVTNSLSGLLTLVNQASAVPSFRIISGTQSVNRQPMYLVPNGSTNGFSLKSTSTNLSTIINNASVTFSADLSLSGLSLAPSTNNTCTVNDGTLSGGQTTFLQGETGNNSGNAPGNSTQITINSIGTAISALASTVQAFKIVHSGVTEYFIAEVDTANNRLWNAKRGYFFDSTGSWIPRVAVSNGDTITLMKQTYVFATYNSSVYGVDVTYTLPSVAFTQPSSPSVGDYWFDLVNGVWKKYNGSAFVTTNAIPVGVVIQDTANTVAARSNDFYKPFSYLNTIDLLTPVTTDNMRVKTIGTKISVYGNLIDFKTTLPNWNMPAALDSGVTQNNSWNYWFYIGDTGSLFVSDVAPHDRTRDLLGYYHPAKPCRCIGTVTTNSSGHFDASVTNVSTVNYYQTFVPSNYITTSMIQSGAVTTSTLATNLAIPGKAVTVGASNAVTSAYNDTNILWVLRGQMTSAGGAVNANGFSGLRNAAGDYTINFSVAFADFPSVVVTASFPSVPTATWVMVYGVSASQVSYFTLNSSGTKVDTAAQFIAIGQRP